MKIKSVFYILAAGLLLTACEKRHIDENLPGPTLYIVNPGLVSTTTFYDITQTYDYSVYAYCAGFENVATACKLNYTPELVESYNEANQTALELLPEDCYTVLNTQGTTDASRSVQFPIRFDIEKLTQLCEGDFAKLANYVVPFTLTGDGAVPLAEDRSTVLISPKLEAAYVYLMNSGYTKVISDNASDIEEYEFTFVAAFDNQWDIELDIDYSADALAEVNELYQTHFISLLPEGAFEVVGEPALAAGQKELTITFRVDTGKLTGTGIFTIPMVLKGTSLVKVDEERFARALYVYRQPEPEYFGSLTKLNYAGYTIEPDAISWQSASTAPQYAFDGNTATSWMGMWSTAGGSSGTSGGWGTVYSYPYWLLVDMGASVTVCALGRIPRPESNYCSDVKAYYYEMSMDGTNWYRIGQIDVGKPVNADEQFLALDGDVTLRYLRVTFTAWNRGSNSCDSAEINMYSRP